RLDPRHVLLVRPAADLDLDRGVAEIAIAAQLVLERLRAALGVIVSAGGVDADPLVVLAAAIALGEETLERLALDLRHGVPDRAVEHANRARALAMAAQLLVAHHHGPAAARIEDR